MIAMQPSMTGFSAALAAMARNNAWANHRLLTACAGLSQSDFTLERSGFFPSIRLTLQHILEVDRFYIDSLEGGSLGLSAFELPLPRTVADLHTEQTAWDGRLIAFCDGLSADDLGREVQMVRADGHIQAERTDLTLLHLFQHQVHHRGQAHAMLSATEVPPPQLDEFFFEEEAPLRAEDFRALGWTGTGNWWQDHGWQN